MPGVLFDLVRCKSFGHYAQVETKEVPMMTSLNQIESVVDLDLVPRLQEDDVLVVFSSDRDIVITSNRTVPPVILFWDTVRPHVTVQTSSVEPTFGTRSIHRSPCKFSQVYRILSNEKYNEKVELDPFPEDAVTVSSVCFKLAQRDVWHYLGRERASISMASGEISDEALKAFVPYVTALQTDADFRNAVRCLRPVFLAMQCVTSVSVAIRVTLNAAASARIARAVDFFNVVFPNRRADFRGNEIVVTGVDVAGRSTVYYAIAGDQPKVVPLDALGIGSREFLQTLPATDVVCLPVQYRQKSGSMTTTEEFLAVDSAVPFYMSPDADRETTDLVAGPAPATVDVTGRSAVWVRGYFLKLAARNKWKAFGLASWQTCVRAVPV